MGASDGVDSATWADPPSFVRKKKIARAQFGEEGARDPAGHGLARRVHVIPRPAGGRGSSLFRSDGRGPGGPFGRAAGGSLFRSGGRDQVDHVGERGTISSFARGGTRWFPFSGGRWLAIPGRPAAH